MIYHMASGLGQPGKDSLNLLPCRRCSLPLSRGCGARMPNIGPRTGWWRENIAATVPRTGWWRENIAADGREPNAHSPFSVVSSTLQPRPSSPMVSQDEDLINYYFTAPPPLPLGTVPLSPSESWKCNNPVCNKTLQASRKSFSNLRTHLKSCIGTDFRERYVAMVQETNKRRLGFESYVAITARHHDIYHWLRYVIVCYNPLSDVDDPVGRSLANRSNVSSRTLRRYIPRLVELVEAAVRVSIPRHFGLMFDGWTDVSTHFIGMIATYMEKDVAGHEQYRERLLGCSPPLNESGFTADHHVELINWVLRHYGRSETGPTVLIGDNCSTNKSVATKLKVPLIGCANHKLNIAVDAIIEKDATLKTQLAVVDKIMSQLCNLKPAHLLREETELVALKRNITRWSSTFFMLQRFFDLEDHLRLIPDVCDKLPKGAARKMLQDALVAFSKYAQVDRMLQKKGISFVEMADLMAVICKDHPELTTYLGQTPSRTTIIHDDTFEDAVLKVSRGNANQLSGAQKKLMRKLEINDANDEEDEHPARKKTKRVRKTSKLKDNSYRDSVQARVADLKRRQDGQQYANMGFITGSSASIERLFSKAKRIRTETP